MARLIDAKILERQVKQAFKDSNPYAMGQLLRWIRIQPTVDSVEIVHGRWEVECRNRKKCSNCGHGRNIETQLGWNYCPNCGADMRGDGNA